MEPRFFSFNSHQGACPSCQGLGVVLEFDDQLMIPDPDKAIGKGGVAPLKRNGPAGMFAGRFLRRFCKDFKVNPDTAMKDVDPDIVHVLLHGTDESSERRYRAAWEGVIPMLTGWFHKTDSDYAKEFLTEFMAEHDCPTCHGDRLSAAPLSVYLRGRAEIPGDVVEHRRLHGLSDDATGGTSPTSPGSTSRPRSGSSTGSTSRKRSARSPSPS
ncbi:MAG: hypothetical protein HC923_05530 [Myxococcales bacterium]|nr:hypothetical protein [Myxococcales bacterium]